MAPHIEHDILISGAGPVGLCLARALAGAGLSIALVDQQSEAALAEPAFDGREIALTQDSAAALRTLDIWARIEAEAPGAFSPLRDAQVQNGPSPFAMVIPHTLAARSELGWLVSNHLIRRGAWQSMQAASAAHGDIALHLGAAVVSVQVDAQRAAVTLAGGQQLTARLLIAADSRFSATRRAVGIAASQHDFGRTMLVCQMTHERPHDHVAWEWFGYGQTLALLPMNDCPVTGMPRSSVVLTLPHQGITPLMTLEEGAFGAELTRRFAHRLGAMQLASTRHAYPLVGVMPHRLVAPRVACVGDAAVGMHPVTAHGFNFGLHSVATLAPLLRAAAASGQDVAAPALLARYERAHRRATRPLYEITRAIATLYTAESPAARLARDAALRVGQALTPFKRLVAASLAGHG